MCRQLAPWYSILALELNNSHPRFQAENLDKNKNIYDRIESLGKKHGCTPAQLALAWVLQQGQDVVPIP
ncbi:Aldo/keto-reductase family protein, partial [Trifolium medium]|nr:Aldo/keto-reductase family protein [Trifolium medium]